MNYSEAVDLLCCGKIEGLSFKELKALREKTLKAISLSNPRYSGMSCCIAHGFYTMKKIRKNGKWEDKAVPKDAFLNHDLYALLKAIDKEILKGSGN